MKIAIIGAGASGLIAAITAARLGAEVTLIERQNRVGKKILVTGNGRCNLTNYEMGDAYFHTSSKTQVFPPIHLIDVDQTIHFFEELGITKLIENGKVYPQSEQAASVVDVLREEVERLLVDVKLECKVSQILKKEGKWHLFTEGKKIKEVDKVIVATGGMAAPQLGCDASGYELLKQVGHTKVTPVPTLVHILSPSKFCKMLQGTRIKANASIYEENRLKRTEFGEVLFTEDGLSGPPIFQLSRIAAKSKEKDVSCKVSLDLFKDQTEAELIDVLYERIGKQSHKSIEGMLIGHLNKKLIVPLIKAADIGSVTAPCIDLEYDMVKRLAQTMKNFSFDVSGTRGFKFAQATAGGICLEEVNLRTMESKCTKDLYLTGELLDVDGDCGGYNLQWAWSTGVLAAVSACKQEEENK